MFVVCVGLSRSASTLQYNIARELVCNKLGGKDFGYSKSKRYIYRIVSSYSKGGNAIIKTHRYCDFYKDELFVKGNVKFLCTFRDLREVTVSIMRAYNASFEDRMKKRDLEIEIERFHKSKQLRPLLIQNYTELVTDLEKAVGDIADFLEIDLSENDILRICEDYSRASQKKKIEEYNKTLKCKFVSCINNFFNKVNPTSIKPYGLVINRNKNTGLHFNHIAAAPTDWRTQLNQEQKKTLRAITSDWLIEVGIEKDDNW